MEEKIFSMLVTEEHIGLVLGIFSILYMLKTCKRISSYLFSSEDGTPGKGRWLVAPINLVLSAVGVFLLGLTTFTTLGMKVVTVFIASCTTTFGYEVIKNILKKLIAKLLGKCISTAPTE